MADAAFDQTIQQAASTIPQKEARTETYMQRSLAAQETLKKTAASAQTDIENIYKNFPQPPKELNDPAYQPTPPPQYKADSPLENFGNLATVVGVFGGLLTKTPMITSLRAAAGAMNAYHQRNVEDFNHNYESWKANTDYVKSILDWKLKLYETAISAGKNNVDQILANLKVAGAQAQASDEEYKTVLSDVDSARKYNIDLKKLNSELEKNAAEIERAHAMTEYYKQGGPRKLTPEQAAIEREQQRRADAGEPPMEWGDYAAIHLKFKDKAPEAARLAQEKLDQDARFKQMDYDLKARGLDQKKAHDLAELDFKARQLIDKQWQPLSDPAKLDANGNATPFMYNPILKKATTLDGQPYEPSGAAKLGAVKPVVPQTDEERQANGAAASTGIPLSQLIPGWGQDAVAARRQAKADAIKYIMDTNPGMTADAAGIEYANRTIAYQAGKRSIGQLNTMLGATKQAVSQLEYNTKMASEEMAKLPGTDLTPIINGVLRGIQRWDGDPRYTRLFFFMNAAAMESSRILQGGQASIAQLHEGAREEAQKWANINMTPASWKAVAQAMDQEGKNRIENFQMAIQSQQFGAGGMPAGNTGGAPVMTQEQYDAAQPGTKYRLPSDPPGTSRTKP